MKPDQYSPDDDSTKDGERDPRPAPPSKRMPLWLRVVLMGLLVAFAMAAFYLNNLKVIEHLQNR